MPAADNVIRVLLVERYQSKIVAIRTLLARSTGVQFVVEKAESLSDALQRLRTGGIDMVLLDSKLPDGEGLEGLGMLSCRFTDIPVIMLTGIDNKDLAPEALRMGAKDCIVKENVDSKLLGQLILRHAKRG